MPFTATGRSAKTKTARCLRREAWLVQHRPCLPGTQQPRGVSVLPCQAERWRAERHRPELPQTRGQAQAWAPLHSSQEVTRTFPTPVWRELGDFSCLLYSVPCGLNSLQGSGIIFCDHKKCNKSSFHQKEKRGISSGTKNVVSQRPAVLPPDPGRDPPTALHTASLPSSLLLPGATDTHTQAPAKDWSPGTQEKVRTSRVGSRAPQAQDSWSQTSWLCTRLRGTCFCLLPHRTLPE